MTTRQELDKLVCSCNQPECKNEELHLRPGCHPECEPVNVKYNKEGILILSCPVCGRHIVTIVVAERN